MRKDRHALALGRRGARKGGLARAARLTAERRREIARQAAHARWGRGDERVPIVATGRRIERGARNELAEALRRAVWQARDPDRWAEVCRRSLEARLRSSWAPVVDILGRG